MSPLTHFIGSWLVGASATDSARDRKLVTLVGVLPDLDGLGILVDAGKSLIYGQPFAAESYARYHHLLLHGWPGALVLSGVLVAFARRKLRVLLLCLLTFHLHLACDLLGSRGPAPTDLWPICYSEPLFRHPIWFWKGQWRLEGWQNQLVFLGVFALALWLAARRGYSFVEVFNRKADAAFVGVLQKWGAGLKQRLRRN
jgi:inner membrane protein